MKKILIVLTTLLLLAGCSARDEDLDEKLDVNFETLSAVELIDVLDALALDQRPADFKASIRPEEVIVYSGQEERSIPLEDEFYLSVAPYVNTTHDCFYHSPTTCTGELSRQEVEVSITKDDGTVLFQGNKTTFENGFIGFWLPRNVEGTMTFSYQGKSVSSKFATNDDDPTCVTTLQLV